MPILGLILVIPQGYILGPSLFTLFFNDFMYILKHTSAVNYADDNTLGSRGDTLGRKLLRMPKLIQNLQSHGIRTIKCRQMPQNSIICTLARTQTQLFNVKVSI